MNKPATICVFCGSNVGRDRRYRQAAENLGRVLAEQEIRLVYGGGSVGLMGRLADSVLSGGGEVLGVIPEALDKKEIAHPGLTEMFVVTGMHSRKAKMAELSDAFIALPGGLGTLEELFETVTWSQLGYHSKAVGLLNIGGYFDPLLEFLDRAVKEGFVAPEHRRLLLEQSDVQKLLQAVDEWSPPPTHRWIGREEL